MRRAPWVCARPRRSRARSRRRDRGSRRRAARGRGRRCRTRSRAQGSRERARRRGPGRSSFQTDDLPAAFNRYPAQDLVGVHRDRVRDVLEQGQIVLRVAVEPDRRKRREYAALTGQPFLYTRYLPLAETGRSRGFSGEPSLPDFEFGRDQVQAEFARDGRGDEGVGGGDDRAKVSVTEVPPNELHPFCADDGLDLGSHEFGVPFVELPARVTRERGELEFEKLVDVEGALLVLQEKTVVLRFVFGALEHAALDQELRPLVVAVPREQRVVEVEERQFQVLSPLASTLGGVEQAERFLEQRERDRALALQRIPVEGV